jgi:hypothetical protein
MDRQSKLVLERPHSVWEMLVATFEVYRRVPFFFLILAATVVVPYEAIVLVITGKGPLAVGQMAFVPRQLLVAIDSFLVTPLVSALHVHAAREVGDGGQPKLFPTLRRSLPTLPVVAIAAGVSSIAITAGSFVLVPGLILAAMWAVVAQAAALERGGWTDALRRSVDLTRGYRWHALGLIFVAALVAGVPWVPAWLAFRHTTTTGVLFLTGTAAQVLLRSFEALITALLYFDLTARSREGAKASASGPKPPRIPGDPLTPDGYTDEDRPRGWYVDLENPGHMRYWLADGAGVWSDRTAKTPNQTFEEWRKVRGSEPDQRS